MGLPGGTFTVVKILSNKMQAAGIVAAPGASAKSRKACPSQPAPGEDVLWKDLGRQHRRAGGQGPIWIPEDGRDHQAGVTEP